MFADIVGFTKRSAQLGADLIVVELNQIFGHIDKLAEARGVEKIKTIGDAYFAVSGVPQPVADHAERIAEFALDIQAMARDWRSDTWPDLQFRIVIHSGPVVAGVIGRTKFAYDVWGDTVNTAAHLEGFCQPGQILVTELAAAALQDHFSCEYLGEYELRDKGKIQVFGSLARKPN